MLKGGLRGDLRGAGNMAGGAQPQRCLLGARGGLRSLTSGSPPRTPRIVRAYVCVCVCVCSRGARARVRNRVRVFCGTCGWVGGRVRACVRARLRACTVPIARQHTRTHALPLSTPLVVVTPSMSLRMCFSTVCSSSAWSLQSRRGQFVGQSGLTNVRSRGASSVLSAVCRRSARLAAPSRPWQQGQRPATKPAGGGARCPSPPQSPHPRA